MTVNLIWSYGGDRHGDSFYGTGKSIYIGETEASARQYASSVGVRQTTVEQLAAAADISKGAFYKFYTSKELLFFEVLEELHTEIYAAAEKALMGVAGQPDWERAYIAMLTACEALERSGLLPFMERDVPYLLRKIPAEIHAAHYHSDAVHIEALLREAGLTPKGGYELTAAAVRGLMLTLSHREEIGTHYPEILKLIITGICRELFA